MQKKFVSKIVFVLFCLSVFVATNSAAISKNKGRYIASQISSTGGGTIKGTLINKATKEPVDGVSVALFVPGGLVQKWVKTNGQGTFYLHNIPSTACHIWFSVKMHPIHNVPIAFFLKDANGNKMTFHLKHGQKVDIGKIIFEIKNDEINAIVQNR